MQHTSALAGDYDAATAEYLAALDAVMYTGKCLLIDADNHKVRWVSSLGKAQDELAAGRAATMARGLNPGVLSADIDPVPERAMLGDACAEALVAWCVEHELRYLARRSGRPGGWHVYAAARAPLQARAWAKACARLSKKLGIVVDDRTRKVMRTLSAPHRQGLASPVVSCTLTPQTVVAVPPREHPKSVVKTRAPKARTSVGDGSRSAREFGRSCAMARAGYSGAQAWKLISGKGAKSRRSEGWWRRYIWVHAVTIAAAENGLTQDQAWQAALEACPPRVARITFTWWRPLWRKAACDAEEARPRRYRVDEAAAQPDPMVETQIADVRRGLDAAADTVLAGLRMRRDRQQGIKTLLYHLAPFLVTREGSVSVRDLARATRMDDKTVRRVRDDAITCGLLVYRRRYSGGTKSCDAFAVTADVETAIERARSEKSPTSCSTPAPTGRCHAAKQDKRHGNERKVWVLLNDALAQLAPGERLATSRTRPAKLLRSMWAQRKWFRDQTPEQQEQRRAERRKLLRGLDAADLRAWLLWLEQREKIANACDRILAGTPDPYDGYLIENAPMTIYRGMRDPAWSTAGTRVPAHHILAFEAVAA
ncbi:hypothetical protein [Nocardia tengchongensis]|uniref:hypothetical protein n=1 Tax=Nocardia tengchongensis TaxID=2055889 RepID=UPI003676D796